MSEQPAASDNSHHGPGLGGTWPDAPPRQPNQRRHAAVWCGFLAGIGVGIMVAALIHAIEQSSPNGVYGFGGTVWYVVVIAGSLLGFGIGGVAAALIPPAMSLGEARPSPVAGAETAGGS